MVDEQLNDRAQCAVLERYRIERRSTVTFVIDGNTAVRRVAVVSFNLGVEVGQLAIVCAILPSAYLCRHSWLYPRVVLGAGSLCIVAIAFVWLVERSFNLSIFS